MSKVILFIKKFRRVSTMKNYISRREFFKTATLAAAATAGVSCTEKSPYPRMEIS